MSDDKVEENLATAIVPAAVATVPAQVPETALVLAEQATSSKGDIVVAVPPKKTANAPKVLTPEEIKRKRFEDAMPYFTKFVNLLTEILDGYKSYKNSASDQVNKRFATFKGFYESAKADDDLDEFLALIYKTYLEVKLSIREDKEVKGDWLGKELPPLKLNIQVDKKQQPPIVMLSSIYNRANELREYREKQVQTALAAKTGMNKSDMDSMIDALRKEYPDLDYIYKFYLYLLYLYKLVVKDEKDLGTITERITTLEIMLDIKDGTASNIGSSTGILEIASKFAKQAGFDIPTDKIPTDKLNKTFDNLLNSKALSGMFGKVASNMKGQSFEKAIGGAMETLATPESINAIKESHKEFLGDDYDPAKEPEMDTAALSNFAKGFVKLTSDISKVAPKKASSKSEI